MAYKESKQDSLHTHLPFLTGYYDSVFTKSASLLGGLSLSGIEGKTVNAQEASKLSSAARYFVEGFREEAILHQYYVHLEGERVSVKDRDDRLMDRLTKRREDFINLRGVAKSKLLHFIEVPTDEDMNEIWSSTFFRHLCFSPISKESRNFIKLRLSEKGAVFAGEKILEEQHEKLENFKQIHKDWFGMFMPGSLSHESVKKLKLNDIWSFSKFLINLDPDALDDSEKLPLDNWDHYLGQGDIEVVNIAGVGTVLKIAGSRCVYAKIASIVGNGEKSVIESAWTQTNKQPCSQRGNYIIMNRFVPQTRLQRSAMITKKRNELTQSTISIKKALLGEMKGDAAEEEAKKNEEVEKAIQELNAAEYSDDIYGNYSSYVIVFDTDPEKMASAYRNITSSLKTAGFKYIHESSGLKQAFMSAQLGNSYRYLREQEYTSSQYGALNLLYRSQEGQKNWSIDSTYTEEAFYIFESEDGTPFYFSPFVDGKCFIVAVGPTGSGKTFVRTTLATHFQKFNGFYTALDFDAGTEPLAEVMNDRSNIYRVSGGFNPFATYDDTEDTQFRAHFVRQLEFMLQQNTATDMKEIFKDEQKDLDIELTHMIKKYSGSERTFSRYLQNLNKETREKFARYSPTGAYSAVYNAGINGNPPDSGISNSRITIYNLTDLKNEVLKAASGEAPQLPLVMNELIYRTLKVFENPENLGVPKYLDIDEAHIPLSIPKTPELLENKIRTWRKEFAGIALWSQGPKEYMGIPGWGVIRSAATTFFFLADPAMNEDEYKEAFLLSSAHCEVIKKLHPKREAFIVQPALGIAKVVRLVVENEQYMINTSSPGERDIRNKEFAACDNAEKDKAIDRSIKKLRLDDKFKNNYKPQY